MSNYLSGTVALLPHGEGPQLHACGLQRAREKEWQRKKAELATPEGQAEKIHALRKQRTLSNK